MPAKKGKKGKGKGKKGKKKAAKLKAAVEKEEVKGKTKLFYRVYPAYCAAAGSIPAPRVITACRDCIEDDIPLNKVKKLEFSTNSHLRKCQGVFDPPLSHTPTVCARDWPRTESTQISGYQGEKGPLWKASLHKTDLSH